MALLFIDSFDHYDDVDDKYTSGFSGFDTGRHGQAITFMDSIIAMDNITGNTIILGFAVYDTDFNMQVVDYNGSNMGNFSVHTDGSIEWQYFNSCRFGFRSAPNVIVTSQWNYIEIKYVYDQHGSVNVVVNGTDVPLDELTYDASTFGFTQSDFDSRGSNDGSGNSAADYFPLRGIRIIGRKLDDLYILDGSGSAPFNDYLGDVEIGVIRPNGVGDSATFTAVGALNNWDNVNDTTPDDDSTYNAAATSGVKDLHEMEDVDPAIPIIGAQLLVSSRRTDNGFASVRAIMKHSGVEYPGVTWPIGNTYYFRNREVYENAPDGSAWTAAKLNAIQAGYERTA